MADCVQQRQSVTFNFAYVPPADLLVDAGLMTDVPPCSCGPTIHRNCVHHSDGWIRIRRNLGKRKSIAARRRRQLTEPHKESPMIAPIVKQFDTEQELFDHADAINEAGNHHPDVPIIDANGTAVLACLAGCYADHLAYYTSDEDGVMHPQGCCECPDQNRDWKPRFPVFALAVAEPT